jgi:hypothetical protein
MLQSQIMHVVFKVKRWLRFLSIFLLAILGLSASAQIPGDQTQIMRSFTRDIEFDFIGWTLEAFKVKWQEFSLNTSSFLNQESQQQLALQHLETIASIQRLEWELNLIYADPNIGDPEKSSAPLRQDLEILYHRRDITAPVAEAILQSQINVIVDEFGLSLGGQTLPPTLYRSTPLPTALILSPRNVIRQIDDISLIPDLHVDKRFELEEQVDRALNVSSLVVDIGGVGTYPTMVQQTSNLVWLSEVVAHEWVHNFLTLRPLGMNYLTSPELRIMNETTASMAGMEIGQALLERYYPELAPPREKEKPADGAKEAVPENQPEEPVFDFRNEMHITRLRVDELLAQGEIEKAEAYMEARRVTFWENGYKGLRKLNQAYFAFHGAYADTPGGAAGASEDPVGEAVRTLRAQSASLAVFLNRISWMYSFEQLQQAVAALPESSQDGN